MQEFGKEDSIPPSEYFADFSSSYSKEIDQLLLSLSDRRVDVETQALVDTLYIYLSNRAESSAILARLDPEEFEHLKSTQAHHLRFILGAGAAPEEHYKRAVEVGWLHALIGLSLPMMMGAYHHYRRVVNQLQESPFLDMQQRARLHGALDQRLHLHREAQITSYVRFERAIALLLVRIDEAIQEAGNLADLMAQVLQVLGSFDGILACLFTRPDAKGVMQIEAEGGQEGQLYAESLLSQRAPLFKIQEDAKEGKGPAGRAWRTGQIQVNNSHQNEDVMQPWRAEAKTRGFRSSAAVPLLDESGQTFAILSLYSCWTGFFSGAKRKAMLRCIQQAMSHAALHREQTTVVPVALRRAYHQYLDDGAVEMLYQPVVNLRTGKLDSVEALARLRDAQGHLIEPSAFLPTFGNAALLRLFQLGLDQACRHTQMWRQQDTHLNLPVGLNLPPNGLTQDVYRDSIFETLTRWKLPASILMLEMLETKESLDIAKRDVRIAEFRQAGILVEQDDLGSGHSSLLRMDSVPCDRVKIDQALVRNALKRPLRALEFIYHLTLLAHDFGVPVIVEGLEDDALIEAATILGADYGQGYGIARPMPAQDVMSWKRAWSFPINAERPRTALGALAGFLLWDRKLEMLTDWPDSVISHIKEPSLVHRYLNREGKSDPELSIMLERIQIAALQGQKSHNYIRMRHELIEKLSMVWLCTKAGD